MTERSLDGRESGLISIDELAAIFDEVESALSLATPEELRAFNEAYEAGAPIIPTRDALASELRTPLREIDGVRFRVIGECDPPDESKAVLADKPCLASAECNLVEALASDANSARGEFSIGSHAENCEAMIGNEARDLVNGQDGDDQLYGWCGNDSLVGPGFDKMDANKHRWKEVCGLAQFETDGLAPQLQQQQFMMKVQSGRRFFVEMRDRVSEASDIWLAYDRIENPPAYLRFGNDQFNFQI